ncbi:hypothetical protein [Chloroherpeton thalassium]|uniref:hypothetical protein n=1 Tax=Chloroherpeton thalassium TaxID=100716 RepID=UPI000674FB87|nr:hypothetical protein [Chloroherpeton thalassium]
MKRKGHQNEPINLFQQALALERRAAAHFPAEPSAEPTRSILYRSAASLAFHANDFRNAYLLAKQGLNGFPPPEIETELIELYEQVSSHLGKVPSRRQKGKRGKKNGSGINKALYSKRKHKGRKKIGNSIVREL